MTGDTDRRKVSMNILGSRLSFKLPKVKVFKKKTEPEWKRESEWSWQAVDSPTLQDNNNKTHHNSHSQDRGHKSENRHHRFLSRDQVDTIHQWLEQLPRPEEVTPLLSEDQEELNTSEMRHLGNTSVVSEREAHYRPDHHQHRPHHKHSIQTEIF